MSWWNTDNIEDLVGKTIVEIYDGHSEMIFTLDDGTKYIMYHEQDCCESVSIEDIVGDLNDLKNSPILTAEERISGDDPIVNEWEMSDGTKYRSEPESFTWTFYELATIKGSVTIRWYGTSNGYYSESVTFKKLD